MWLPCTSPELKFCVANSREVLINASKIALSNHEDISVSVKYYKPSCLPCLSLSNTGNVKKFKM